jgi:hypothetical protein
MFFALNSIIKKRLLQFFEKFDDEYSNRESLVKSENNHNNEDENNSFNRGGGWTRGTGSTKKLFEADSGSPKLVDSLFQITSNKNRRENVNMIKNDLSNFSPEPVSRAQREDTLNYGDRNIPHVVFQRTIDKNPYAMSDIARSSEKMSTQELRDSLESSQAESNLLKRVKTIQNNLENHLSRSIEAKDRRSQDNSTCKRQHTYQLAPSHNLYEETDKPETIKHQIEENLRKERYKEDYEKKKDRLFHKFLFNRLLQKIQLKTKFVFGLLKNFRVHLKHFSRVLGILTEANRMRKISVGFAGLRGYGGSVVGQREKLLKKIVGRFGVRKKGEIWGKLQG